MPPTPPSSKALDTYYAAMAAYRAQSVVNEQATRLAFSTLLDTLARSSGWTLVLEQALSSRGRPDGTLIDDVRFPRGYWEAKDSQDDLQAEVQAKIRRGYPLTNARARAVSRAVPSPPAPSPKGRGVGG